MVAERVAHLLQKIVAGAKPLDPKQCSASLFRELLQVFFDRGFGKVGKLLHRFARGDHAKPGILERKTLHQPRKRRVLDSLMLILQRLQAIQEKQGLFPADEFGQPLALGPG